MPRKIRLDILLPTKGLAKSRHHAQQLIRAGMVKDNYGTVLDKPGKEVSEDLEVQIKETSQFVSRGGEKLIAAFRSFPIDVRDKICLDAGISTGGFTDCLLQQGASKVYGVDVGYGQTAWQLRTDKRVILKERTNIRKLTPLELYGENDPLPSFAVADLSFISLKIVLPALTSLLFPEKAESLLLVKPQFEVGPDRVSKGGVVKDPAAHVDAINNVIEVAKQKEWKIKGLIPSPLTGPAGNHEYLLWLGQSPSIACIDIPSIVAKTLS